MLVAAGIFRPADSGRAEYALACSRLMPDFLTISFFTAAIVALVAGMVRGFAGFGAAMVMTPVFSALYGPAVGIVLCMLLEIVVALPLLPRALQYVDWRRIGLLMVAAVVGAPLGNLVLTQVAPKPMRWAISAIVLGARRGLVGEFSAWWKARRRPG